MMILSQKIRIFPTIKQEEVLNILSERCRLLHNFSLSDRRNNWDENKALPKEERNLLTYNKQSAELKNVKKNYTEYKWVYSKVLQQILKKLDDEYKTFIELVKKGDTNARPPKFRGKKYFTPSATTSRDSRFLKEKG